MSLSLIISRKSKKVCGGAKIEALRAIGCPVFYGKMGFLRGKIGQFLHRDSRPSWRSLWTARSLLPLFSASLLAVSLVACRSRAAFVCGRRLALSAAGRPSCSAPAGWRGESGSRYLVSPLKRVVAATPRRSYGVASRSVRLSTYGSLLLLSKDFVRKQAKETGR